VDPHAFDDIPDDGATRPGDDFQFLKQAPRTEPGRSPVDSHEDLTTTANLDGLAAMERTGRGLPQDPERTRTVDIRNDQSISDIDWDLD